MADHISSQLSKDSQQIIQSGLEKIKDLNAKDEELFAKALKKSGSGVKVVLEDGTVLSIRVFDQNFSSTLKGIDQSKIPEKKHQIIQDLLKQVEKHNVVFTISRTDEGKEYIFSDDATRTNFQAKKGQTPQRSFTTLDTASQTAISSAAQIISQALAENGAAAPEESQAAPATTDATNKKQTTAATPAQTQLPPQENLQPDVKTAKTTTKSPETAISEGVAKANEEAEAQAEHIKEDQKRKQEQQDTLKRDSIEHTEEERQKMRLEGAVNTNQAGDSGSVKDEERRDLDAAKNTQPPTTNSPVEQKSQEVNQNSVTQNSVKEPSAPASAQIESDSTSTQGEGVP